MDFVKQSYALRQAQSTKVHYDDNDVDHMGEIMGFLIQPKSPPEDRVFWLPAAIKGKHALETVNDTMNNKIQWPQPPQARGKPQNDPEGKYSMDPGMDKKRLKPLFSRLPLVQRHPVCLQQEITGIVLDTEQYV